MPGGRCKIWVDGCSGRRRGRSPRRTECPTPGVAGAPENLGSNAYRVQPRRGPRGAKPDPYEVRVAKIVRGCKGLSCVP